MLYLILEMEEHKLGTVAFKVDAGLVDRLGRELVGRAETAVSELVKNAYDADATNVEVNFINTNLPGGTLKITDNGIGMNFSQLKAGFMTISSTDKVHNPKSLRFGRRKAGRKGIGRFATQRLGEKLTIITQTKDAPNALKITINWDQYKIDTEITSIQNKVETVDKIQEEGTVLIIEKLREAWTEAAIIRIYRYVSELLQPDYLSDRSEQLGLAKQKNESFKAQFIQTIDDEEHIVADPDRMLFSKALAIIEGYVDKSHDAYCSVSSESLEINNDIITIEYNKPKERPQSKYLHLRDIHFKVYYFIYNRPDYYTNISKLELSNILKISQEQSGVRLYRNGFRVLPYGEQNNDWLNIDRRYYDESGVTNTPFGNHNLFGFVEVVDPEGKLFEETASREGLIENEAYLELKDFVSKALEAGRLRIRYGVDKIRKKKQQTQLPILAESGKSPIEKLKDLEEQFQSFFEEKGQQEETRQQYKHNAKRIVGELKQDFQNLLDELGMLRVLGGLGLTIGEFTHEVVQFSPSINGDLSVIEDQSLDLEGIEAISNLKRTIELFTSYTSYFNATVSANVTRELKPQRLDLVVSNFKRIIEADIKKLNISLSTEYYGYELITIPMHASEWSSILFNLYTNAKKAIRRASVAGKIGIICGSENRNVYLEFTDNGDGIPEDNKDRVFDAFFTTSSPTGFEASQDEKSTGTGLGLKIVRDIVHTYKGTINLIAPETGYSTCFRIELPMATSKQREEYAL